MNIQKAKIKFYIAIPISAFLIQLWNREVSKLIDPLAIQILAILVGFIIGAVGVLIALLGNLFNNIIASLDKFDSRCRI